MQTRTATSVSSLEEAKVATPTATVGRTNQSRVLPGRIPVRILQLFALFLVLCISISGISFFMIRHFGVGVPSIANPLQPSFQPRVDQPSGLWDWIRPPSNLLHTMTDEELLWRASFVPRRNKYPFTRVPKVAFMFLSKGQLPLAPLWEQFFKGHEGFYSIYMHSMPSFQPHFPASSVFYGRQIPSKIVEWGRMSMCDAERRLLANALFDFSNEWFVLLSESCIPLYNFSLVYHYIARSNHSFIGAFDDHGPYGRGRYNIKMAPMINITHWRKGSQWFEINRRLAISIVEDTKFYPNFEQYCKPYCYVDEHYFPTMLTIQAPNALANRSLTWVDWSRGGSHPATFGSADVSEDFLKKIQSGQHCIYNGKPFSVCFLFARKFAPSTLEPLMRLAPKVLGF